MNNAGDISRIVKFCPRFRFSVSLTDFCSGSGTTVATQKLITTVLQRNSFVRPSHALIVQA